MIYLRDTDVNKVLTIWAQMSGEGWMTTIVCVKEREKNSMRQSRKEQEMYVWEDGGAGGGGAGQSGYRPRTLCLSENQISHPDSITTVFLRRGNTLSSAISRLVSLQNLSLAR